MVDAAWAGCARLSPIRCHLVSSPILCSCATLAAAVRDEAQAWVRGIAGVLAEGDAAQLDTLRQQASWGFARVVGLASQGMQKSHA